MRKAIFAGKLYESDFDTLTKQIEDSFESGPGALPIDNRTKVVKGIFVPACNYAISGSSSAWAFKEIPESKFPELYILLGSCEGDKVYMSHEDFETPLGVVKNIKLHSKNEHIILDEAKHKDARDIELLLPFLQYVSKDKLNQLMIMPLLIGKDCPYNTLLDIAKALKSIEKDFIVIACGNFTYFGEKYNNIPFRYNVLEEVKNIDMTALGFANNFNTEKFWKLSDRFNLRCKNVLAIMLELFDEAELKLLDYNNSSPHTGTKNFITYSSILF